MVHHVFTLALWWGLNSEVANTTTTTITITTTAEVDGSCLPSLALFLRERMYGTSVIV
jgi:hypothetical protein